MKWYKKLILIIIFLLALITPMVGCKKVDYYSGLETIYPRNMPSATSFPTKPLDSSISVQGEFIYRFSLEDLFSANSEQDSWFRVTVDRLLKDTEIKELKGYIRNDENMYTYFEITLWYDYVNETKCENKAIIRQVGKGERNAIAQIYQVGVTYIMLLRPTGIHYVDHIGPIGSENAVFVVYTENGKEVVYKLIGRFDDLSSLEINFDTRNIPEGYEYEQCFNIESLNEKLRISWNANILDTEKKDTDNIIGEDTVNEDYYEE